LKTQLAAEFGTSCELPGLRTETVSQIFLLRAGNSNKSRRGNQAMPDIAQPKNDELTLVYLPGIGTGPGFHGRSGRKTDKYYY
jgi:hypothetical protein